MRLLFTLACLGLTSLASAQQQRQMSLAELRDRVRGAWAGKIIGVAFGAPTEFKFRGEIIPPEKLPQWKPAMVREALRQDDLYVQMTFASVLDAKGPAATTADYAEVFKQTKYSLWHANEATRRALRRGASPDDTGTPKYN